MNYNEQTSKTNAKTVKKQNAASAQGQTENAEFASETDVQEVKKQNQQAEANKNQASNNYSN